MDKAFDELPVKVLIVEDDLAYAAMLKETLDSTTVKIVGIAYDGWTAVAMWQELKPACLLTDLALPGTLTGPDVIRRVKEYSPEAIIIGITGTDDSELKDEASAAGAQAVFRKQDYPPITKTNGYALTERNGVTYP